MWSSTKLLVVASFLVIISGLGFLWFGWGQTKNLQLVPSPFPTPIIESESSATRSAALGIEGERVLVRQVVDGDTIVVLSGVKDEETVRFVGADTPETVDPRRSVGCFGKEASSETKKLLSGKMVILQKDISDTDKYKRLLRYVFLPLENNQFLFVNDYLIREGFAKVLTYPPDVKYDEQFRQAEKEAKENKRGLWGKCD